ncbi:MAG TPA: hypothetical protein VN802_11130 [Stellaceae bacterium]|nr:hypothetical protein [Stellaceae bacterium]
MARFLPVLTTVAAVAVAVYAFPASAAGPYDGNWIIDAPPAGGAIGAEGQYTCPALRMPFAVKDGQVMGDLHRTATGTIEIGKTSNSAPVTGTVGGDGTVSVTWENFHVSGKLSGAGGNVNWAGECGPRTATATKVGQ